MASEWVRLAVDCRRRAIEWNQHALRWEDSRDASLRRASQHATLVAGRAEQMAAELRVAAQALLELLTPAY